MTVSRTVNRLICQFMLSALAATWGSAALGAVSVVVSVKPIHSLVSSIMHGVASPELLLTGSDSPHDAALRPTQARMLQNANVVVWMGPALEGFLEKPIQAIANDSKIITLLSEVGQMDLLPFREPHEFSVTDPTLKQTQKHDDHDHDHDGHLDPHVWLDPIRAARLSRHIAEQLASADVSNAKQYRANAARLQRELRTLSEQITERLTGAQSVKLLVFHDGFQYFEKRFGLRVIGSVSVNPALPNSARHIRKIRRLLQTENIRCAFSEPQFDSELLAGMLTGTNTRLMVLDPLGATLKPGRNLYQRLMVTMADTVGACLDG